MGKNSKRSKKRSGIRKKEYDQINNFARELNIDWFASAWDEDSLVFLKQYNCKYNKIASAMIVDKKFLENVANEKNIHLSPLECPQWMILNLQLKFLKIKVVRLS